jgi:hypothetical protein
VRHHRSLIRVALVLGIAVVAVVTSWHGTIRTLPAQAGPAQTTKLGPGQGAWAYTAAGGTLQFR